MLAWKRASAEASQATEAGISSSFAFPSERRRKHARPPKPCEQAMRKQGKRPTSEASGKDRSEPTPTSFKRANAQPAGQGKQGKGASPSTQQPLLSLYSLVNRQATRRRQPILATKKSQSSEATSERESERESEPPPPPLHTRAAALPHTCSYV
jgi:hypothetical protein